MSSASSRGGLWAIANGVSSHLSGTAASEKRALVILPTYNEAENVLPLAGEIQDVHPALEILVVDDNSPDGTGDIVADAQASQPRLHLLRRAGKQGLGTAYLAGFRYGLEREFDTIFTMVDVDAVNVFPDVLDRMEVYEVTPGPGDTLHVEATAGLIPALESALGRSLRLVTTGGDAVGSVREQWDDGNNTRPVAPVVVIQ